jgi:Family of unknown function (DUF6118)
VKKLCAIEQHPAIRMSAVRYQQTIVNAGTMLIEEAARRVHDSSRGVSEQASLLAQSIGIARTKHQQIKLLAGSAGAALLIGVLLSPFLARLLPFGLDEHIAALVLHQDRWDAGGQLMAADNPHGYRVLREAAELFRGNQATLDQCREAAVKAKKEQRCTIMVSATP